MAVLERHGRNGNIGKGFVTGFGPLRGAIASSIGHDSHNLIVAGNSESDMAVAVNHLIDLQGGAVVVQDGRVQADLPLPVAGLMSDRDFGFVEARLRPLRAAAAACGCTMIEPLLQLAFLPLPVIPHSSSPTVATSRPDPMAYGCWSPRRPARKPVSRRTSARWPSPDRRHHRTRPCLTVPWSRPS